MNTNNHQRRSEGYGINLYRNVEDAKIAGVCSGLADQFDISPNVVRWVFFGSLFFVGGTSFLLYIIAWFLMAPKPKHVEEQFRYDEEQHRYRRKNMFNYGRTSSSRLKEAERRMSAIIERIESMERYVTSKRYRVSKEINNI